MTIPSFNQQHRIATKSQDDRPLIITSDFLRGGAIEDITSYLQNLTNRHHKSALELFQNSKKPSLVDDILGLLVEKAEHAPYKERYDEWRSTKALEHNLIHFLEFLALNDFHRIHFFLKIVHKIKPATNYQYVYGGLALSTCGAAIAFYLRPDWWNIVLEAIIVTAPSVGLWLLKYILIPQNLAALLIGYVLIETFVKIYLTLSNHSTSNEHKTTKILRQLINCAFIVSAQILCFMNLGLITQTAATLFITAALFEMLWALQEYCQLSKPEQLSLDEQSNLLKAIHYEDQMSYYQRKEQQLLVAVIVLVLISIATTISILFGGQFLFISLLSIAFQWLVSRYKDVSIENTENHIAQYLQSYISNVYPNRPTIEDTHKVDEIKTILSSNFSENKKLTQINMLFNQHDINNPDPNETYVPSP